jgi:hypothetical protein
MYSAYAEFRAFAGISKSIANALGHIAVRPNRRGFGRVRQVIDFSRIAVFGLAAGCKFMRAISDMSELTARSMRS